MGIKSLSTIINLIAFIVNLILALSFILQGYISKNPMFSAMPSTEDSLVGNLSILSGVTLLAVSLLMLIKKSTILYIASILIALISMLAWMRFVASMDMRFALYIYLIIFLPLSFLKYKLSNTNQKPNKG